MIPLIGGTQSYYNHGERKSDKWWLPGSWGTRDWKLFFNGYRVSVLQDERVLGLDGGDGCTTLQM